MQKIDLDELKAKLDTDLTSGYISSRVLLDRFCLVDNDSRKTAPYLDNKYCPFYYHLGKYVEPKNFLEIGFNLGLISACFLTSCKTVENFYGFKEISEEFVPIKLGKRNIKLVYKKKTDILIGKIYEMEKFLPNSIDLVILNIESGYDQHLEYLDLIWSKLSENGLIIAEYIDRHVPAKEAFFAFSENKNRKTQKISTRYGTAILQK